MGVLSLFLEASVLIGLGAAILLFTFMVFYVIFFPLRMVGFIAAHRRLALAAVPIALMAVFTMPSRVLPFSVRLRMAGMGKMFPNIARTGFRYADVPRLIEVMGRSGSVQVDDAIIASEILCGFGARVIPELTVAVDSSNTRLKEHAFTTLACINRRLPEERRQNSQ